MKRVVSITLFILFISPAFLQSGNSSWKETTKRVNGVEMFWKVKGKGEPIVLVHGGPGLFHDYFLPYMEELTKDYQVVLYDQRGNGRSPVVISPETYNFKLLIEDLEALRKELGFKKFHLLGHSFGGYIAMKYAIEYSKNLKSLILVNSAPAKREFFIKSVQKRAKKITPEDQKRIQQLMKDLNQNSGNIEALNTLLEIMGKVSLHDPKNADEILATMKLNETTGRNMLRINKLQAGLLKNYDISDKISVIQCPTLVMDAESDFMVPESAEFMKSKIKETQVVKLKKCGHYPFAENPKAFFKTLRKFLNHLK